MFNRDKLRGKMAEKRCTTEKMANYLGINPATLYRKTSGSSEFTRSEIQPVAALLDLSVQEITDIFFAEELA